jgi:hypothetical protein
MGSIFGIIILVSRSHHHNCLLLLPSQPVVVFVIFPLNCCLSIPVIVLATCFLDLVCIKNPDVCEDSRHLLCSTIATSIIVKGMTVSDEANANVFLSDIMFRY